ncbi:cation:proton antiporter regulatory subunit [Actinoalloteichus hymeniacidonis]|uniref:TrkA-C domain-containing protein n=1 Tax=Actinoalloteichus hymeniacidonis TaxID=340345 RepID=A0AAC9MZX4_9PSEU|nr:TrkA C-terminal domain-containing protein [Actinoalloteichus hymeniacidonis]AOS64381.1 TrkA-C domain-containing protein [Actinoalloteichus hymeniacidonis]MBB5907551.1 TrkA domain protein [Actinoalloteichus hymeniacidonis]
MHVDVTALPGIGTRQDFRTGSGRRLGVITHRDGRLELIISDPDDEDTCRVSVPLTAEETGALAALLGTPELVLQLREEHSQVDGVTTSQLPIAPGSPFATRSLADTALRTRTGASVVAVARAGEVIPSPRPDFVFQAHDLIIIVGTDAGLALAAEILERG